MTHEIVYRHRMEYDTKAAGVVLPVTLLANDRVAAVNAAVDTGSTLVFFSMRSPKGWGSGWRRD